MNRAKLVPLPNNLAAWIEGYQQLAVTGVRSLNVAQKISLYLTRFKTFFEQAYGPKRISSCWVR